MQTTTATNRHEACTTAHVIHQMEHCRLRANMSGCRYEARRWWLTFDGFLAEVIRRADELGDHLASMWLEKDESYDDREEAA